MSRYYYTEPGRGITQEGPFQTETDLLYCRLVSPGSNELMFEAGILSPDRNTCYRELAANDYLFEVETSGLRTAQYLDYPLVIDDQMIHAVHLDFIYKYNTLLREVLFSGPGISRNPKPPLSPGMLMYLNFEWFKLIRVVNENNILSAAGVDERIPRLLDGGESQQCFRRRIQMRRDGRFPPLVDEPWPPCCYATSI